MVERELSFSRLERGDHDKLHISSADWWGVYFPWHRHQIEGPTSSERHSDKQYLMLRARFLGLHLIMKKKEEETLFVNGIVTVGAV